MEAEVEAEAEEVEVGMKDYVYLGVTGRAF